MRTHILFAVLAVFASSVNAADDDLLLARLRASFPGTQFDSVRPTPLAGIYEVRMGSNIAYTDAVGKVWLLGHLYDRTTGRDLTSERLTEVRLGDNAAPAPQVSAVAEAEAPAGVGALKAEDAIVRVNGSGKRKLLVFSDVDCSYCKKLEAELAQLEDVTILTYPVAFLSDGFRAESVWCSSDRVEGWAKAMRGQDVHRQEGRCDAPVRQNTRTAMRLGVRGTPTMLRADGARLAGYASASRIDAWLGR